jgi:hypothetical protein
MRGNTLRFQAQYLKKIRVPKPGNIDADVQEVLRKAFRSRDVEAATEAALDAYQLDRGAFIEGKVKSVAPPAPVSVALQDRPAAEAVIHDLLINKLTDVRGGVMAAELPELQIQDVIEDFWFKRDEQTSRLADGGTSGGAARANGHMGSVTDFVGKLFEDAGIDKTDIKKGAPYLPGYYRIRKQWDLVVVHRGHLVAAVEFKSQVGSVGKNFNNRFEEALGTATDTLTAQRKFQPYGEVPPWLAYVFVLQETDETEAARNGTALFPVDPEFKGMSYNQRYQTMLSRFMGDQIYHAGWFVTTKRGLDNSVTFVEPLATAAYKSFAVAIKGRVDYVKTVAEQESAHDPTEPRLF